MIARGTPNLPPDVEVVQADVTEDLPGAVPLEEALAGATTLFHLAGFVSRDPADGQRMMRVHIEGTRRVLRAAAVAGVQRVILASTSGTVAVSKTGAPIPDESWPAPIELVGEWPYYLSKIYQENLALKLAQSLKLDVVVVNPSLLLGPGDERNSSTDDVRRFLRGKIPFVPSGGVSFVDVRDAAQAMIAARDVGRPGERYLLGAANWTFAEFFGRLERISKVRGPRLKIPDAWATRASGALGHLFSLIDRPSPVEPQSVAMSQVYWYCNSDKAKRELGFDPRDPSETLVDTLRDVRQRLL